MEETYLEQPTPNDAGSRAPVTLSGWTVEGVSVAGQETCILLPQLKVAFDIGRCPQRAISHPSVFISHGHMDHIGGIPFHVATRSLYKQLPSKIYSIPQCCKAVQQMLEIHADLEQEALPADVHVLEVGDEVRLSKSHVIRPFKTVHVIPSQGYMVVSQRSKLKSEFEGKPKEAIIEAKKAGVPITDLIEVPEVAFTGDTCIDFVHSDENAAVFKAKLLIMELTFIDDQVDQEGARARGHMHIDDLVAHADKFQNEAILLIHFSARHRPQEILDALDARLPQDLRRRCYPFLQGFSLT